MIKQSILIDQLIIGIIGSSASHRESIVGKLFQSVIPSLELIIDDKYTKESIKQKKDIVETRKEFPIFLTNLRLLYENIWLLLSSLFHPGNRTKSK